MLKYRKTLLLALFLLFLTLLTGCGQKKSAAMADENAVAIEPPIEITGTWSAPGGSKQLIFNEDGSCRDTKQKIDGTYQFYDSNSSFTIADMFENVYYITCTDKKGKIFFTGAVLGDLISGYQENLRSESYYISPDREEIEISEILGNWKDVNGDEYKISLGEDATVVTTDWTGTYELTVNEEYGSSLILHFKDYDEKYAVLKYEGYMFLYREGTSLVYQLEQLD